MPLKEATAETVYKTVKECLQDTLNITEHIGIGTDGASSMVGCLYSLITLLRIGNPNITLIKCECHSLHLVESKSCDELSTVIDFTVKETHTWFANSAERRQTYTKLYEVLENSVPKKIPRLASTRRLSRLETVNVILDQWEALKLHCNMCYHTAKQLSQVFKDQQNKPLLLFVRKTLKEVVRINKLFQGHDADITKLTENLDMCRNLMQVVVEPYV